jgi:geranylgeranyl diphosphate synthase type II
MACLDSLERAFSRVRELGIPNVAVPLLTNGCSATTAEMDVLHGWLRCADGAGAPRTRSYLPALRQAEGLFDAGALEELLDGLAGRRQGTPSDETEAIALGWLREGGKRSRPFITLAGYAAVSGRDLFPPAVRRIALAIEAFHKASLVHDDIEDNDPFRYGRRTLHRRYGVGAALNVGDYLVGLGYGLIASAGGGLGAGAVADVLGHVSDAHTKLCRGQGEELLWARRDLLTVRPQDVQRIYALKTAPAFEAALCAGLRAAMQEAIDKARYDLLRRFCRFVGVAYQLLNDINDWEADGRGKRLAGQDGIAWRPTMLLAFALEAGEAGPLRELVSTRPEGAERERWLLGLRELYEARGAFARGRRLVDEYRRHARAEADAAQPEALRDLLHLIVEAVL